MHRDVLKAHCGRFLLRNRLETTQIVKIVILKAFFFFILKKIENPDAILGASLSVEKIWELGRCVRLVLITVSNWAKRLQASS